MARVRFGAAAREFFRIHLWQAEAAESAWLRWLRIEIRRWSEVEGRTAPAFLPGTQNPGVLRSWQFINECWGTGPVHATLPGHVAELRFTAARLQGGFRVRAMPEAAPPADATGENLRLETPLSLTAAAAKVGYPEPHAFTRTLRGSAASVPRAGATIRRLPGEWRGGGAGYSSQMQTYSARLQVAHGSSSSLKRKFCGLAVAVALNWTTRL